MADKQKRVSDHIGCPYNQAAEMSVEDTGARDLVLTDYMVRDGRFGPTAHVLCADPETGEALCIRTTSGVVIDQLEKIKHLLPLIGQFHLEKNYHILR